NDCCVVRRDLAGKELWKRVDRNSNEFVACQRLPSGNFFLVTEESMAEVTPEGKQVALYAFTDFNPGDAWKLRNGQIVCRHDEGVAVLDGFSGRVIRDGPVEKARFNMVNKFAVLPDGRCVVVDPRQNKVIEVHADGQTARVLPVRGASGVEALRNG